MASVVYEPRKTGERLEIDPETGQGIVIQEPEPDTSMLQLILVLGLSTIGVVVLIGFIMIMEYHDLLWG